MDPSTTNKGKFYPNLGRRLPITSTKENKYIYVMYVYDCNTILTTVTKNRNDKEMIQAFTELITNLKIHGINPGFHFIDKIVSSASKMEMATMDINHQLVPPSHHKSKKSEREIEMLKNHFKAGLCSIKGNLCFQLWDRLPQKAKKSTNVLRKSIVHPHLSAYIHIREEF